jgi:Glycosyltransferase family 87
MKFLLKQITIAKHKFDVATIIWFALAAIAVLTELRWGIEHVNNYLIFKEVFYNTLHQTNLYVEYPQEAHYIYFDGNHYGPLFSTLIAPFALLNNYVGCFLWCIANAFVLWYAVKHLPVPATKKNIVLLIGALEMMTAIHNTQFNPMLTGWIVLTFVLVEKEQDFWAAFFIVAGFLIKLYGVAGLPFFLFSKHKVKFILSGFFWLAVLFALPMLYSSPKYIVQCYQDWYHSLVDKNAKNMVGDASGFMQDISLLGMIRRIFNPNLKNYLITVPAATLFLLPLARIKQYQHLFFRMSYLALVLIGVVIFSSSSENATYVIAMLGVGLWYIMIEEKKAWHNWLLVFVLLLTSASSTDLFKIGNLKDYVHQYSLKALPCFIVWCILMYQLTFKNYGKPIAKV